MIKLDETEKDLIRNGREFLKKNNIKRFYQYLNNYSPVVIGRITQFLLENNINLFDYLDAVPENMFYGTDIDSISIPDGITRIKMNAFAECKNLSNVDLGNTVKNIDAKAFDGCQKLTQVFLPDSLTVLGASVFNNCNPKLVLVANKRTGGNRLKCKQNEIPWYKEHLFMRNDNTKEE